jgi:FkbM family methyltransferase
VTFTAPLPPTDLGSRTSRDAAVQQADAALTAGDLGTAEALCRGVLARDVEHEDAFALLLTVLLQQGRLLEGVTLTTRSLAHFRELQRRNSTAFGLHLLHERGFRPRGVLDIGAYHGEFAMLARAVFPDPPVVMVEPQAARQERLRTVARELGGDTHVVAALLGAAPADAVPFELLDTQFGSTGSSLYPELSEHPRTTVTLPMTTLDAVRAGLPDRHFDLLKIDVQGAELDVLRGGPATLQAIEVLFVELSLHACNRGAPRFAEVVAALAALGFHAFELLQLPRDRVVPQRQTDAIFVRDSSPLWRG